MGMEVQSADFAFPLTICNVYGPCQDRVTFWNDLMSKSFLKDKSLVLGGDLNFSIGRAEAWGPSAREDPLSDFFLNMFTVNNLIDINLLKLKPTWRNRRTGDARVAKRLDRFLINEELASRIPMFRQWIEEGGLSDHFPVFLEFSIPPPKPPAPFKFNSSWLQDDSFNNLFKQTWKHPEANAHEDKGFLFMENLKRLRKATISWVKARKEAQNEDFNKISEELKKLESIEEDGYVSQASKDRIIHLEKLKNQILLAKEEEWRLKSRAIWLKAGDENTRFFHNYAKGRKSENTIWSLKTEEGREVQTFKSLSELGQRHFQKLFADPGVTTIADVINIAQCFSSFLEEDEAEDLYCQVTKEEVESTIKSMAKEKSPGPDGWSIELFLHFFDLIGAEITEVVEESRKKGEVYSPYNANFIDLIPKKEVPESFEDFRPISLCNSIYKIIAKVIANRIKPILSRHISMEQFGFLSGRQIHEAIGVAQEVMHSVKQKNKKGAVIKIDLSKSYDRINWLYIKLLLTHLGFKTDFISWIMGCISNVSYAILINGAASSFFKGQQGLRQGCPLSPLLFLLVAEGLSQLIHKARREGKIKGIEVATNLFISHLLFVDDILIFTNSEQIEIKELKNILELLLKATGMQINSRKSQLIMTGIASQERARLPSFFPFQPSTLELPFKAGRLTLIKSVLLAIPVYWAALTWATKGIMEKIRRLCSIFLWDGSKENQVLPWVAWDKVARSKEWGGWGIKILPDFSLSLAAKLGWRLIKMENLWTKVVKRKYIDPVPLEDWIRNPFKNKQNVSVIWKATVESFKVIEQGLAWKIGNGRNLKIGKDPWIGCNENYALSPGLIRHLEGKSIFTLDQVEKMGQSNMWGQAWKDGGDLELDQRWWNEQHSFTQELFHSNVRLKDSPDMLIWAHGETGDYSPKDGYKFILSKKGWGEPEWWSKHIWKLKCPTKARLFFWCLLRRKIPTWDTLQSRYMHGPRRCTLCKDEVESINHLFLNCIETKNIWGELEKLMNKKFEWGNGNLDEAWSKWWHQYPKGNMRNLPPIICWGVWLARNRSIFQDKGTPPNVTAIQAVSIYTSILEPEEKKSQNGNKTVQIKEGIPWAFFDGASQKNQAGAGIIIHLNAKHSLKASVGLGPGSNNFAELSALRLLLWWLIQRNTFRIQVFGDSLNVINWVNGKSTCKNQILKSMLEELQVLKTSFNNFSLCHIYRDSNEPADKLSKEGLQQILGGWKIVEDRQGQVLTSELPPYA
eukprot:PITA_30057